VPNDWVEFSAPFIDEVKLGIHADWQWINDDTIIVAVDGQRTSGPGIMVQSWRGIPRHAYAIRPGRILGSPVPIRIVDA